VVQVHYDEGVAIYIGPEPCVGVREDGGEASVGVGMGQPLSRESQSPGADALSGSAFRTVALTREDGFKLLSGMANHRIGEEYP
jgi:hypothetical protein